MTTANTQTTIAVVKWWRNPNRTRAHRDWHTFYRHANHAGRSGT